MNWIFFAILAPAIYASATYIDKYILEKEIEEYDSMPIYMAIVGLIAGCFFFTITGFPLLNLRDTCLILTTGILTTISSVFYFKALAYEDTGKINFLFQIFPIISLVLGFVLLRETITIQQLLGFLFILFATVGISVEKRKGKFYISKAFFLILIVDVLWATSGVLMKFAIKTNSFSNVLSYESFGIFLGGFLIFIFYPNSKNAFLKNIKIVRKNTIKIILLNESIVVFAKAVTFYAFSLGPLGLVSVLEGAQTFYAIVYGWFLTITFPLIFHEDITKRGLFKKIVLFLILLLGIYLLF